MNRRQFLAAGIGATVAPMLAASPFPQQDRRKPKMGNPKKFSTWVWTGIDGNATTEALKAKYRALKDHGLTGVFIGGGINDREFDVIRENGLELHTWMWTTNRGDGWIRENHPEWYMVSRSGKSCFDKPPYVDYYRWINPVIPGVQSYLRDKVAELAVHPAVQGVHLDYVRYPDVILPKALWKTYNLDQTEELPDYDFDYSDATVEAFRTQTGRDIQKIEDPAHDQEWLHFRYHAVSNLVAILAKTAHREGKQITAAVFPTPRLARRICRQDWGGWPLDLACPMIYHSFYEEPVSWIGDCMIENIQSAAMPIVAGLYMPAFAKPAELMEAVKLVRKRGGAGVSLFGDVTAEYWKALSAGLS